MKFVMSYSCGKDSTLALYHMLRAGHTPVGLLVMVKRAETRSYFHGAAPDMLRRYGQALDLPLLLCPSDGADYHTALEEGLHRARALGAGGPPSATSTWRPTGPGRRPAARPPG